MTNYISKVFIFTYPFNEICDIIQKNFQNYLAAATPIGLNFCTINIKKFLKDFYFQAWLFNASEIYNFAFPKYIRGSVAIFFMFKLNVFENIKIQLLFWINLIKSSNINFPLYFIGFFSNSELNYIKNINHFFQTNNISNFYLINDNFKIKNVFKDLTKNIIKLKKNRLLIPFDILYFTNIQDIPEYQEQFIQSNNNLIDSLSSLREELLRELAELRDILENRQLQFEDSYKQKIENLTCKERLEYEKFLEFYSKCPLCGSNNHKNYLNAFYFSDEKEKIILKDFLIYYMDFSHKNPFYFEIKNIKFGIPCCNCYKIYFDENEIQIA